MTKTIEDYERESKLLNDQVTHLQAKCTQLELARRLAVTESKGGGILSGYAIIDAVKAGEIDIDPFVEENVNPASIDLRLGNVFKTYENTTSDYTFLDCRREEPTTTMIVEDGLPVVLRPGILYLGHTLETVHAQRHVPVLDGKSSIGRLGIKIHETAGYGDPGFHGQYTLEITVVHPIRVYPGMRFCQMRFHMVAGAIRSYAERGNYQGSAASGPVPSMAWKQFG